MYIRHKKVIGETRFPRCHYIKVKHHWKPKVSYNSKEEAHIELKKLKLNKNYTIYICPVCNKWHIGFKKHD